MVSPNHYNFERRVEREIECAYEILLMVCKMDELAEEQMLRQKANSQQSAANSESAAKVARRAKRAPPKKNYSSSSGEFLGFSWSDKDKDGLECRTQ